MDLIRKDKGQMSTNTKQNTDTSTQANTSASTKRKTLSDGQTFEHKGHSFKFEVKHDEHMGPPWKEHDGHGVVSDWTDRPETASERAIAYDRGSHLFYDIDATIELALKDSWGVDEKTKADLSKEYKGKGLKYEIARAATMQDFERMKGWCQNEWWWVGVVVTMLKADEDAPNGYFETKHRKSLWGIESDSEEFLSDTGYELAEEILRETGKVVSA